MAKEIIKEEQTVNEVQLRDLYTAASKVEIQIVNLSELAVSFSDQKIKQAVMVLRSRAHELSTLIGDVMMSSNAPISDLEGMPRDSGEEDTKVALDAPSEKNVIESEEKDGETIEEAQDDNFIGEAMSIGQHAMQFVTRRYGINESHARQILAEAFTTVPRETKAIDLSAAYTMITEGKCQFAEFKNVVLKAMNEAEFGAEFKKLVSELRDAGTPNLYEAAMNKIYDFADANEIVIKTI